VVILFALVPYRQDRDGTSRFDFKKRDETGLRETASMTKADSVSPGASTLWASARIFSETRRGGIVRDLGSLMMAIA
jgi:hypothetical protein